MRKTCCIIFTIVFLLCSACGADKSVFASSVDSEAMFGCASSAEMSEIQKAENDIQNEVVTLTLAVPGIEIGDNEYIEDNMWSEVIAEFNKAQSKIQIETCVYPGDDTQLRLELISGEGPDLILTGAFGNAQVLTAMGALVDLYPYLDKDNEISRDSFLNLEILELDGKLTRVSSKYYISTYYGTQDAYGDEPGWTLEECMATLKSAESPQAVLGNITGSGFVADLIGAYAAKYVDYEKAECNFSTDEFRAILEVAKAINLNGEDVDVYATQTQTQQEFFATYPNVIYPARIAGVSGFTTFLNVNAGIPVNLMGLPCEVGNGAKAAFLQPISVCEYTQNGEECWEFIKYFLTNKELCEDTNYFPVYEVHLKKQIEDAISEQVIRSQESPQLLLSAAALGDTVTPEFTLEEAELLYYLLYEAPTLYGYDPVVSPITLEEVEEYLNGNKSQDDVISIIENRLTIYLSEIGA